MMSESLSEAAARLCGQGVIGAVVAAARGDSAPAIGAAGIADLARGAPMTVAHSFRIASITKTYLAAVLLQLADEGVADLAAPISRWLPNLPLADVVTLGHVLMHTGGLPTFSLYRIEDFPPASESLTTSSYVERAYAETAPRRPDGRFEYANVGSRIIGLVLERATGASLDALIEERLLRPLDLRDTRASGSHEPPPHPLARGYYVASPDAEPLDVTFRVPPNMLWSGGDMYATAADLVRWMRALFGGKVLSANGTARLVSERVSGQFPGSSMSHHGLGVMIFRRGGHEMCGYRGSTPGFVGVAAYHPTSRTAIAVQTNSFAPDADSVLRTDVETALFDVLRRI